MLEVVLSAVMLSLISAAIVAAIGFVTGAQARRAVRLEAYEIANRLILQYLDDPLAMPDDQKPYVAESGRSYRFELEVQPAKVDGRSTRVLNESRFLVARVFSGLDAGSGVVARGSELAQITRYYNVMAASFRNEDAKGRTITSQWYLENLMRLGQGVGAAPRREPTPAPAGGRGNP